MSQPEQLITEHIDIWTSAILAKSTAGRGSSKKYELYGIKKLRELILELAIRGKLVAQNSNDEPVSVLLEKIAAEKTELIKEGKIKKSKPLAKIDKDEKLFELPKGWQWCRLRDIGHDWGQKKPDVDFTYIDVGSVNKELGLIENARITNAEEAPSRARKLVKKGTVLYSTVRPYLLNIAVVDKNIFPEPIASTAFAIIHPLEGVSSSFIYRYLRSPSFVGYVESCQTGIAYPAINDKQFFNGLIPLPPKEEQNRIVAKVDELMLLCDQLEQQTEASMDAHATLVEVLLATLTDSADANELAQNWARVSECFDSLFTTEQSIEALKQTVLQLAVMGKLVPQNPDDEPASKLLEKIAEEKAQLVKEKKVKREKILSNISDDEKPFELPQGWALCRFSQLSLEVSTGPFGSMINKRDYIKDGIPLINPSHMINGEIVENKSITVSDEKAQALSSYRLSKNDLVMARRGEMGRCAIVTHKEDNWLCGTGSFFIKFNETISRNFLVNMFSSSWVKAYLGGNSIGTTMTNLNHGILNKMPVMLPPVAEQHRIVAKVDELMKICDQLKDQLQQSQVTQVQLTNALIDNALRTRAT